MTIKNKITPELKSRFLQEIHKTIANGNEHGFLICSDNQGNLSPSKTAIGEKDHINFIDISNKCPIKIQGDFHTHSPVSDMRNFIKEKLPEEKVSESTIRDITIKLYKENGLTTTGPSHGDLLGLLVLKGRGKVIGTVCMSSDAEPDKVECWTAKDNAIQNDHYQRSSIEIQDDGLLRNPPHNWIKSLFNKEMISLK